MHQFENCRCLALAILIVVGLHAKSRVGVETELLGTMPAEQQHAANKIGGMTF